MTLVYSHVPAQETPADADFFAPGSTFIYMVDFVDSEYLFISEIVSLDENGLDSKWFISNNGSQGKLAISPEALESATTLHNYFVDGDYVLEDKTSGWVSRKVMQEILANGKTVLDIGEEEPVEFTLDYQGQDPEFENALFYYPVGVDARFTDIGSLSAFSIVNEDKGYKIVILNNEDKPMILYMDLGWTISLEAII